MIDQTMTHAFIAQSIFRAPDFRSTTLQMPMLRASVSHAEYIITD